MSLGPDYVELEGSTRSPYPTSRGGPLDLNETIEVTVVLKPAAAPGPADTQRDITPPGSRQYLSRTELLAARGAAPKDVQAVEAFAKQHGLKVVRADAGQRTVVLSGNTAAMNAAFGVQIEQAEGPEGRFRVRNGPLFVPRSLAPVIQTVMGLDTRPQAKTHFRVLNRKVHQAHNTFTPPQVASLYGFPTGVDGSGQCIAFIELGGGYTTSDMTTYFGQLGLPTPRVTAVLVDGAANAPGDPNGADGEVMLDLEVAGGVAPGTQLAVYFAPNTSRGFYDAVVAAIHDNANKPSVISISWGGPESTWTVADMTAMDQAFQDAAAVGVTVCCASGDNGSGDGVGDGLAHVDFPASSPFALACGGTRLMGSGATIHEEVAWHDGANGGATGGGISDVFGVPAYQANAQVPSSVNPGGRRGRGVPDVAGDASPTTGYGILVDGQRMVVGGTSAVSPLWAGLIVLMNQRLGRSVGFLNPLLYGKLSTTGVFRDVTSGSNGGYTSSKGWDPCTGWGSPLGLKLMLALHG